MDYKEVIFKDVYFDDESDEVTLYFETDVKNIKGLIQEPLHKDQKTSMIAVEFENSKMEPKNAKTAIAIRTVKNEYLWVDVDLPYELINQLVEMYNRKG